MEGLDDIVVGPCVEARNLLAPAVARGQDQHRHGPGRTPPALQHGDAVELGQSEIEDHGVIGLGLAEKRALLAVERLFDGGAGVLQRRHDLAVEVLVVLDDEQSHGGQAPVGRVAAQFSVKPDKAQRTVSTLPDWPSSVTRATRPSRFSVVTT